MRALGKVHRNPQLPRRHRQPVHVVRMLVGNDDRIQRLRLLAGQPHAPEQLPAAQPGIQKNPRPPAGDNRAVALGARSQHCEAHHSLRIQPRAVHIGTLWKGAALDAPLDRQ